MTSPAGSGRRRAVFFDRDGTLNEDMGAGGYTALAQPEMLHLLPGVAQALASLQAFGWELVVISNQSGVGRGFFTQQALDEVDGRLRALLAAAGVHLSATYYCPHAPWQSCRCRKPEPGLLLRAALDLDIDLHRSFMVGDMPRDVEAGRAAGCRTVLLRPQNSETEPSAAPSAADASFTSLSEAATWILAQNDI